VTFNPLDHPIIFSTPRRLARVSAWREHIPFGMLLVDLLRPRMLVELGTHWGNSYCGFCQAVDELHVSTECYAVDTWAGDEQTGEYGPDVLADLRGHHDPLYERFSRLVQSTFDEARDYFADNSIDLLHVDGLHTYEAVKHDVESWLPKVSDRGVVLLHDINVRGRDFGVWRVWAELKAERPSFELHHAHGLGAVAIGARQPEAFRQLLEASPEEQETLRRLFHELGYRLRLQLLFRDVRAKQLAAAASLVPVKAALETAQRQLANEEARLDAIQEATARIETTLAALAPPSEGRGDVMRSRGPRHWRRRLLQKPLGTRRAQRRETT
jgi:hypothetical protein